MNKWISTDLENICLKENGAIISGPFGSNISKKYFTPSGVPVIRGNNLSLGKEKYIDSGYVYVSEEKAEELNCYAIRNDLVFTAAGTLGQVGILDGKLKYEKYVISNKQLRARIDNNKVDVLYAYYWYSSPWMQKYFVSNNKGSTVPLVSLAELKRAPIIYPASKTEQSRIVSIFETISRKIDCDRSIYAELESLIKTIYNYWYIQYDFPNEDGEPYRASGGKMVWNEDLKREIPEGWTCIRLGEYISSERGISYTSANLADEGIPMINLASFNVDCTYKPDGIKYIVNAFDENKVLKPYELIMCNTQQTALDPTKDIIGNCLLIPDIFNGPVLSSHHVTHIKCDIEDLKYMIYAESKQPWFHKYVTGFCSGTNILGLDFDGVCAYKMALPPETLLKKFAHIIRTVEQRKSVILREIKELQELRDWLLPMLMNGQATVK